ncbi:FecCD family ABC transporter permease [Rhodobacter sp. NSM]|uniref:FecCD family ABC transporter permease n=1 Tax=Rhodobacter sp. NSM TaxID=3457501 RepID=UPI003FD59513
MTAVLRVVPLLAAAALLSILVGVRQVGPSDLWAILTAYDSTDADHVAVAMVRLPRVLAAIVAGSALGVAGSILQAITRNPLAEPGLLGVNAGAAFALLAGTLVFGGIDQTLAAALTFPGAAIASAAVFALAGGFGGASGPIRLTLAGAALNALLLSLVTAVVMIRQDTLEVMRFWVAGSLAQSATRPLLAMSLAAGTGFVLALILAPRIEALSLGEALARGLGAHPGWTQAGALVAVTLATGAAVGIAGPIAFLGLMVPPLARRLAGHRFRAELWLAAILGASLMLVADTLGRLVLAPSEVRVGIMTAVIGGPAFVWIARSLRPGDAP